MTRGEERLSETGMNREKREREPDRQRETARHSETQRNGLRSPPGERLLVEKVVFL